MTDEEIERSKRLAELIKALGIKKKQFAEALGMSPQYVSHLLTQVRPVTEGTGSKIVRRYKRINFDWLMEGQGEMFLEQGSAPVQEEDDLYMPNAGEPSMEDVERLREDVIARYKPDPSLTVKQDLTLRQACYKTLVDNPGMPWIGMIAGAGVYLRFIQDYSDFTIPGHGFPGGM